MKIINILDDIIDVDEFKEKFVNKNLKEKWNGKFTRIKYKLTAKNGFRRDVLHFLQRKLRGWDDSETWSLDYTIARFALPRLKRFRNITPNSPNDMAMKEWESILDDIIFFLQYYAIDSVFEKHQITKKYGQEKFDERMKNGAKYFAEHFQSLWW